MKRWMLACFAMLSLLMAVASPATAKPADNGGPGNSGAAKLCQKGGWESLAPAENDTVAFLNQDECVSYGAHGGTIVDLVVLDPAINVSFDLTGTAGFCLVQVDLVDFAANTTYPVSVEISYFSDLTTDETYGSSLTTDGDGFASGYPIGSYSELGVGRNWVRATANGITTAWYDIEC